MRLVFGNILYMKICFFPIGESEFRSFINYAPFGKGMPQESPGRVAYFTGYQIVSDYMKNNKIDICELRF